MSTKAQTVNNAFSKLRISGLTVQPSPGNIAMALGVLECLMAELFAMWDVDVGYNFEATPGINSQTNVPLFCQQMMETNLAVRMIPNFNKQVPQELKDFAGALLNSVIGWCAKESARMIQPSRRMPIGNGNTFRGLWLNRYAAPAPLPPNDAFTNYILQGEQFTYQEDFSAFLGLATISSYTIVCDTLLTIVTSANATPVITYTITAPTGTNTGPWNQVLITITDSLGRIDKRIINFVVITPPTVGS